MANSIPPLNLSTAFSNNESSPTISPCTPRNDPSQLMKDVEAVNEVMSRCSPKSSPRKKGTPPRNIPTDSLDLTKRIFRVRSNSEKTILVDVDNIAYAKKANSNPSVSLGAAVEEESFLSQLTNKLNWSIANFIITQAHFKANTKLFFGYLPKEAKQSSESENSITPNYKDGLRREAQSTLLENHYLNLILERCIEDNIFNKNIPAFDVNEFETTFFYEWSKQNIIHLYHYDIVFGGHLDLNLDEKSVLIKLNNYFSLLYKRGLFVFTEKKINLSYNDVKDEIPLEIIKLLMDLAHKINIPIQDYGYFFQRASQLIQVGFEINEKSIYRYESSYTFLLQKAKISYAIDENMVEIETAICKAVGSVNPSNSCKVGVLSVEAKGILELLDFDQIKVNNYKLELIGLERGGVIYTKDEEAESSFVKKTVSPGFDIQAFLDDEMDEWGTEIAQYFGHFEILFTTLFDLNKHFSKLKAIMAVDGMLIFEEIITTEKIVASKKIFTLKEIENLSYFPQMKEILSNLSFEFMSFKSK